MSEQVSIQEALSHVMGDVQSVSKTSRNTQQNFNFRGIDAVMNAVGPALRKHGVVVVPTAATASTESYTTRNGALMKNVMLTVSFRFYGPAGDFIDATAVGEAADAGDKAVSKAHSVAFRTLLLQALCIPTDEPDPDSTTHEREAYAEMPSQAPEKRQETAGRDSVPRTGAQVKERLSGLLGADEAEVWLAQVAEYAKGKTLAPTGLQRLAGVVLDLEADGSDFCDFPADDAREKVQACFAARFDGAVFPGPDWAMNGAETAAGSPTKEEVLDNA